MGVNPEWFTDERSLEMVEMFFFYRDNPALAFPGKFGDQPDIWIQGTMILGAMFPRLT